MENSSSAGSLAIFATAMADLSLSRALVVSKAAEAKLILIALFAISSVD